MSEENKQQENQDDKPKDTLAREVVTYILSVAAVSYGLYVWLH